MSKFSANFLQRKQPTEVLYRKSEEKIYGHHNQEIRKKGFSGRPRTINIQTVKDSLQGEENIKAEKMGRLEQKPLRTNKSDYDQLLLD